MPAVVEQARGPRELPGVGGGQSTKRKPLQVMATGEEHDEEYGEQKRRDRVADDDDSR